MTSGLLEQWMKPEARARFFEHSWRKQPFASAGTAHAASAAYGWDHLDTMLQVAPGLDCLVVSRGKHLDQPQPRTLQQLRALFEQGIGIVVRHADRNSHALLQIGADLQRDVPGEQRVLVFATPRGVNGFGWHYDVEEVFIIQTAGIKEYYFRSNTVEPNPRRGDKPDFSSFKHEKSPLFSCRLLPGDWLYLPSGYWHVAQPQEHSLSISIGIFPE